MTASTVQLAIHQCHGYALFKSDDGKPYVIHKWKTRKKQPDGTLLEEQHEERLDLVKDQFTRNQTAREIFLDLRQAWAEWNAWCGANGK